MWNKGLLSLTGTIKDLRAFVSAEIDARDKNNRPIPGAIKTIVDWPNGFWYQNDSPVPLYVSGLYKGIINNDTIAAHGDKPRDIRTINLSFRSPCDIDESVLQQHSRKYGIDLYVYITNNQERTSRKLHIESGRVVLDDVRDIFEYRPRIIRETTYA